MYSIDTARQRYLDRIHRYLQGSLDYFTFRTCLPSQWAEEREVLWQFVWQATRAQRCLEREQLEKGEAPLTPPSDPRRFPRMLDRLSTLGIQAGQEEPFRASIEALLAAYRCPDSASAEARFVDHPPRIAVFERPLPPGSNHRYLCTVEEIRLQLALVPEYDLEDSVGELAGTSRTCEEYDAYFRPARRALCACKLRSLSAFPRKPSVSPRPPFPRAVPT